MINDKEIIKRAKFLYCGSGKDNCVDTMKQCIKQAIVELTRPEVFMEICNLFDISIEDYADYIIAKMIRGDSDEDDD